ncbi:hypothetical protein Tco_0545402 [Tanacetum coccineum]
MKMFADKDKSDRSFAVGDWVLLKLQPHRQVTLRMHKQHKFSLKFNGPFQVEAKCGKVAYKLTLPDAATIHNVFHVSQLKPFKGQPTIPISLPHCNKEGLITCSSRFGQMEMLMMLLGKWLQICKLDTLHLIPILEDKDVLKGSGMI